MTSVSYVQTVIPYASYKSMCTFFFEYLKKKMDKFVRNIVNEETANDPDPVSAATITTYDA